MQGELVARAGSAGMSRSKHRSWSRVVSAHVLFSVRYHLFLKVPGSRGW